MQGQGSFLPISVRADLGISGKPFVDLTEKGMKKGSAFIELSLLDLWSCYGWQAKEHFGRNILRFPFLPIHFRVPDVSKRKTSIIYKFLPQDDLQVYSANFDLTNFFQSHFLSSDLLFQKILPVFLLK